LKPSALYRSLFIWLALALVALAGYLLVVEWIWQAVYYFIWLLGFGGLFLWQQKPIIAALRAWHIPGKIKFTLLGYSMVLLEEIFAALCNHISEGFALPLYLVRVGQFWAFNLLAFSGLIFGWYFLVRHWHYTYSEAVFWVGLYGFIAEHGLSTLASNPVLAVVLFPLNFFTYGVILSPALLSLDMEQHARSDLHPLWRGVLGLGLPLLLTMPFVALLGMLRTVHPLWFPPRNFIP
jgi:hypothetical protein